MATMLTIGDFSRMTHLSVKALRHYHDMGVLEPAAVDPFTGYRSYDTSQVGSAQVIRRLRDLGMPLDSIAAVLAAPDLEARNREIAAHLTRMERQLEQTQASVAALRALLTGPAVRPAIELRTIAAVTALAVREVVDAAELNDWGSEAFDALAAALAAAGLTAAGPYGGLFDGDFFELERSEVTAFVPVTSETGLVGAGAGVGLDPAGRVRLLRDPRRRGGGRGARGRVQRDRPDLRRAGRGRGRARYRQWTARSASTTWSARPTPTTWASTGPRSAGRSSAPAPLH